MAELEVSGITFAYEETPVLSDVSLKLHEHELVFSEPAGAERRHCSMSLPGFISRSRGR